MSGGGRYCLRNRGNDRRGAESGVERVRYRAEIDGLRALAILPVVAFHAGIGVLSGGFTGVDVFFVISGYLITTIILSDLEGGGFSIAEFYKRRILRILPALSVVLVAVGLASWAIMLPNEFRATGRSVIATALFVSNIHFWRNSGYFEGASDLKPLLHTWSLAVEEQFYLFFPLMLMLVARFSRRRFGLWIWLMVLGSFGLSVLGTRVAPSASFYLLPTRVWELGIGALIAAGGFPRIASERGRDLAAWTGAALLGYGLFALSAESSFPGWNALWPCLGAGLIIAYGAGTGLGRLLSLGPVVYVGRISYSLYLWHWPVIVFYRMLHGQALSPSGIATVIAVSFALAILSFHLIETPFRAPSVRIMPRGRVLWAGGVSILFFLGVGIGIARDGGAWRSYPPEVLRVAAYTEYRKTGEYDYQFGTGDGCSVSGYAEGGAGYDREKCLRLMPDRPNYIVIGDSHAGAIWRAIALAMPEANVLKATISGCRPVLDAPGEAPCRDLFNYVYRDFLPTHKVDGVILVGRWRETDFAQIAPTLTQIKKYVPHLVVFGPTVEYEGEFPLLLASERMNGTPGLTENALDPAKKPLSDRLGMIVAAQNVRYVPVYDGICDAQGCVQTTANGVPMQFDYGHLTLDGAKLVVARFHDQLEAALN